MRACWLFAHPIPPLWTHRPVVAGFATRSMGHAKPGCPIRINALRRHPRRSVGPEVKIADTGFPVTSVLDVQTPIHFPCVLPAGAGKTEAIASMAPSVDPYSNA